MNVFFRKATIPTDQSRKENEIPEVKKNLFRKLTQLKSPFRIGASRIQAHIPTPPPNTMQRNNIPSSDFPQKAAQEAQKNETQTQICWGNKIPDIIEKLNRINENRNNLLKENPNEIDLNKCRNLNNLITGMEQRIMKIDVTKLAPEELKNLEELKKTLISLKQTLSEMFEVATPEKPKKALNELENNYKDLSSSSKEPDSLEGSREKLNQIKERIDLLKKIQKIIPSEKVQSLIIRYEKLQQTYENKIKIPSQLISKLNQPTASNPPITPENLLYGYMSFTSTKMIIDCADEAIRDPKTSIAETKNINIFLRLLANSPQLADEIRKSGHEERLKELKFSDTALSEQTPQAELKTSNEAITPMPSMNKVEYEKCVSNCASACSGLIASSLLEVDVMDLHQIISNAPSAKWNNMCNNVNGLTDYVKEQIVNSNSLEEATLRYKFFIDVGVQCLTNNDFASAFAINSALARLGKFDKMIDKDSRKKRIDLENEVSVLNNAMQIRGRMKAAEETNKSFIPIPQITSKDLTFMNENSDTIQENNVTTINTLKLNLIASAVQKFIESKKNAAADPNFVINSRLQNQIAANNEEKNALLRKLEQEQKTPEQAVTIIETANSNNIQQKMYNLQLADLEKKLSDLAKSDSKKMAIDEQNSLKVVSRAFFQNKSRTGTSENSNRAMSHMLGILNDGIKIIEKEKEKQEQSNIKEYVPSPESLQLNEKLENCIKSLVASQWAGDFFAHAEKKENYTAKFNEMQIRLNQLIH